MSESLYGESIKALASRQGATPERVDATATLDNPLCGDRVGVDIRMEGGRVVELGFRVKGCLLCKAAATAAADHAVGLEAGQAAAIAAQVRAMLKAGAEPAFPALAAFLPVVPHKSRHDCVLLPFRALAQAVGEF